MASVVPNRNPVIGQRSPSLGINRAMEPSAPNITMTRDSPTSTSRAVPISSDQNDRQGKRDLSKLASHLGKLNDDLDVVGLSFESLFELLRLFPARDQTAQPRPVGASEKISGLIPVPLISVDAADNDVVL